MTTAARYNLQRNVPEDTRYKHTTYNVENELDAYVLAKTRRNRLILDAANYDKVIEAAGKEIAAAAQKEINNIFK